uniref:Uncharacterized protein n=1 Tax=Podarcis muralis TaxID=64176 RepID=A0A670KAW7_PODMU
LERYLFIYLSSPHLRDSNRRPYDRQVIGSERKDTLSPWFLYFASLPDVCMAGFPANYNTEYYETEEGVPHYGLFHLSGQEWCFNERRPSQNKCNISCDCE